MNTIKIVHVNIYRAAGAWCYRADDRDGFDHSDPVGLPDDASESAVRAHMLAQFPGSTVDRVADIEA